jgi:hypothetical protein
MNETQLLYANVVNLLGENMTWFLKRWVATLQGNFVFSRIVGNTVLSKHSVRRSSWKMFRIFCDCTAELHSLLLAAERREAVKQFRILLSELHCWEGRLNVLSA